MNKHKVPNMKLYDKIWLRLHKKPNSPLTTYLATLAGGVVIGVLLLLSYASACMTRIVASATFLVAAGAYAWYCYWYDKRKGYVDALQQKYLKRREELREKYGVKQND